MTTYSTLVIVYITLHSVSIFLLSCLIIILLKSESYFTKWTLFQICISAFGGGFCSLLTIVYYGDELSDRAFDNPLCIISQKIQLVFLYPFEFNSCVLAFYLWYALVKKDMDIEKKCYWYFTGAIWTFTLVYNGIVLILSRKEENWGVFASTLNCATSKIISSFYAYVILTSLLAFLAILMSCHSALILQRRWSHFSIIRNRRTAIRLGEAVRLCAWCFTFVIVLVVPLIPRAIQNENPVSYYTTISRISAFGSALVGTLLFLIFGTNKRAAVFLPFYYVRPDRSQPSFSFHEDNLDLSGISDANLKPKVNEVDDSIHFNDKGSNDTSSDDFVGSSQNNCVRD